MICFFMWLYTAYACGMYAYNCGILWHDMHLYREHVYLSQVIEKGI